jgi:hypothetical protein
MREQGWRDFLAAHAGSDWVVLVPELAGVGVLMTIDDGQLTLRLTRGAFRLGASREAVPP